MTTEKATTDAPEPSATGTVVPGASPPEGVQLTREGYERTREELEQAEDVLRPALERRIRRERLFGDPERGSLVVDELRGHLATLDARIAEMNALVARVEVIGEGPEPATVEIGTAVTVRYDDGTEETLSLVGPLEADPARGLVATESPAGRALLGKRTGERVLTGTDGNGLDVDIVAVRRIGRM